MKTRSKQHEHEFDAFTHFCACGKHHPDFAGVVKTVEPQEAAA